MRKIAFVGPLILSSLLVGCPSNGSKEGIAGRAWVENEDGKESSSSD